MNNKKATLKNSGSFDFYIPIEDLPLNCGDYIHLSKETKKYLGLIEKVKNDYQIEQSKHTKKENINFYETINYQVKEYYKGSGRILAEIEDSKINTEFNKMECIGDAELTASSFDIIKNYFETFSKNDIPVGFLTNVTKPFEISFLADEFKRHTGLFGQSGSGKSYALGKIIEESYFKTQFDIVVLDPNGIMLPENWTRG
jgi:hypothetical protein